MGRCIVVLGSGRSGTSLIMSVLQQAGMSLSNNLIEASEQNRGGAFEDSEIFDIHSGLQAALDADPSLPLPEGWVNHPSTKSAMERLSNIVVSRIKSAENIWGFKDPRTACFLPIWIRIFNQHKIVPSYLLTVRDPAAVTSSMYRQYWTPKDTGELIWLRRNLDALSQTGGNCCVVHYEDWVARGHATLDSILEHTGLSEHTDRDSVLKAVDVRADRSTFDTIPIVNQEVRRLYSSLQLVRGCDFDREQLMASVRKCREVGEGYKGWQRMARRKKQQLEEFSRRAEGVEKQHGEKIGRLEKEHKQELKRIELDRDAAKKSELEKLESEHKIELITQSKELEGKILELDLAKLSMAQSEAEFSNRLGELLACRDSLTEQLDQFTAIQDRLKRKEKLLETELKAKRSKLKDKIDQLHLAERDTFRCRYITEIYPLVRNLERTYLSVLSSTRWKLGNLIVRPVELLLLRWNLVLITNQISQLIDELREPPENKDIELYAKHMKGTLQNIGNNFDSLFSSMRWKVGCQLLAPLEWFPGKGHPQQQQKISRIIRKVDRKLNQLLDEIATKAVKNPAINDLALAENNDNYISTELKKEIENSRKSKTREDKPLPSQRAQPHSVIQFSEEDFPANDRWTLKRESTENKISLIMPVYNAENWILDALESIYDQSYTNWELICVDDGSADESAQILERISTADDRIVLIKMHKNQGKSVARNVGLSESTGEYIFFIDADDWLATEALSLLHRRLVDDEVDIAIGQVLKMRENSQVENEGLHAAYQHRRITKKTAAEEPRLLENMIVCNKLVRREFLENNSCIFFNSALARFEDSEVALKWWLNAPTVSLINEYTYFYRQQADDLPCRSNRKPGGLDAAPSHRLALAREILEYRHLVNQDDEVVVLPMILYMLVANLYWDSVAPKSNRLNESLNYAMEAARFLDSSLLNRLELEPRNVLMLLKRGRGTEALKALSLNWNAIRGKKFQVGSI